MSMSGFWHLEWHPSVCWAFCYVCFSTCSSQRTHPRPRYWNGYLNVCALRTLSSYYCWWTRWIYVAPGTQIFWPCRIPDQGLQSLGLRSDAVEASRLLCGKHTHLKRIHHSHLRVPWSPSIASALLWFCGPSSVTAKLTWQSEGSWKESCIRGKYSPWGSAHH